MNKRRIFFTIASVLLVGGLFTGFAYAYGHFYSPEERIAHITDKITKELDLDADQQATLYEIAQAFKDRFVALKASRQQVRQQVTDLVLKDQISTGEIDAFIARRREKFDEIAAFVSEQLLRFHAMLTPDQREQVARHIEAHASKKSWCRFGFGH